jgi:hypothetical protein
MQHTMKKTANWLKIAIAMMALSACSNETEQVDETTLLAGGWKLYKQEMVISSSGDTQELSVNDCHKDNVYKYYLDGSYSVEGGAVMCGTNEKSPVLQNADVDEGILVPTGKWNVRKPFEGLADAGKQQLVSVTSTSLVTRMEFSGLQPIILTYKPAR